MAFAGKIKCDYCGFIGDLIQGNGVNKSALRVPDGWISVHPHIVVHGQRGIKSTTPEWRNRQKLKDKVKEKISILHCCLACVTDRNVFNLDNMLPAPAPRNVTEENLMKVQP